MPKKYFNLDTQLEGGISYNPAVSSTKQRNPTNPTNPINPTNMELMEKYGITPWLRLVYSIHFGKTLKDVLT